MTPPASALLPDGDDFSCPGGVDASPLRFTGQQHDAETGLDDFPARYYASAWGLFTSPDDGSAQSVADGQSWDLYAYTRDDPSSATDPSGHDCISVSNAGDFSAEVTIVRGACPAGSNGTYVNGTVNADSLTYNGTSVGYQYTGYNGGGGAGIIGLPSQGQQDIQTFADAFAATNPLGFIKLFAAESTLAGAGVGELDLAGAAAGAEEGLGRGAEASGLTPEDLLAGAEREGGSDSETYVKPGGMTQAQADFDALPGHAVDRGLVETKELPDGRRAVLRKDPSTWSKGRPSLDLQSPAGGKPTIKIRYK